MRRRFTQNEARAWRDRAQAAEATLRAQRAYWRSDYPGGTHVASVTLTPGIALHAVHIARALEHAVVAVDRGNEILFYALPLAAKEA